MVRAEEGFHGYKDRAEADQWVGAWVHGAGVDAPGEKQTGSEFDE